MFNYTLQVLEHIQIVQPLYLFINPVVPAVKSLPNVSSYGDYYPTVPYKSFTERQLVSQRYHPIKPFRLPLEGNPLQYKYTS